MRNHSATGGSVLRNAALIGANNRQLEALEAHEPLSYVVVGARIDGAPLGIAKELVEGVVGGAFSNFVGIRVQLLGLVYSVVNGTIGRVLGRATVETGGGTSRMLLAVAGIGSHGTITGVVSARFAALTLVAGGAGVAATIGLGRAKQYRVVGVSLDVLLEILRALESFAAEVALVRFQGNMHADMGGDVITLDRRGAAVAPLTGEVEVVGALAADMAFADVVIELFSTRASLAAVLPLADELVGRHRASRVDRRWRRWLLLLLRRLLLRRLLLLLLLLLRRRRLRRRHVGLRLLLVAHIDISTSLAGGSVAGMKMLLGRRSTEAMGSWKKPRAVEEGKVGVGGSSRGRPGLWAE
jgi:hypothetical protein